MEKEAMTREEARAAGWDPQIDPIRNGLKHELGAILAMAGVMLRLQVYFLKRTGNLRDAWAEMAEREVPRATERRHVRTAILLLLRPAESALRRLIVTLGCRLMASQPPPPLSLPPLPPRSFGPKPVPVEPALRKLGIAVTLSREQIRARAAAERKAAKRTVAAAKRKALGLLPRFRLADPRKRFDDRPRLPPRWARPMPRIHFFTDSDPPITPPPKPPAPDDKLDATRLSLRLAVLARALDDLPNEVTRFIRWKQLRERARAADRRVALTPLRPGKPPGGRLLAWEPFKKRKAGTRDIDTLLAECHHLATYALEYRDTS